MEQAVRIRTGNAFRPGTRANHRSHVLLYVAFSIHFQLRDFPATPHRLLLFGEFLTRGFRAPRSVTNAFSSLRGFHLDRGLDASAFDARQVSLFCRSLQHTLRHVPTCAPPLTLAVLEQLCILARCRRQAGLVFASLLSVTFFSMARLSSLAPPTSGPYDFSRFPSFVDLEIRDDTVWLRIKWAKCHQGAGQGFSVPLRSRAGSPACPVALLSTLAGGTRGSPAATPLFSRPRGLGTGGGPGAFFTAGAARRWLSQLLTAAGLAGAGYTFHSLRRGACTLAFQQGASVADLQALGGWRGDSVRLYLPAASARQRAAVFLDPNPTS